MANLGDGIFKSTILGLIFGIPIFVGLAVLSIPFMIISIITGVSMGIIIKNLLVFAVVAFFVWVFSRFQIIENGLTGLAAGTLVYIYFKWHPLVCVLIGVATIGLLFLISNIKIGFWIKTILFSMIVTLLVYMCIYSDTGLFPLSDMVWKTAFIIIFFLENIFIRCSVAHSRGFLFSKSETFKTENHDNLEKNQIEVVAAPPVHNQSPANNSTISEINNVVRKMNAEIQEKQEDEKSADYLMERVYLFSQKKSFWDGRLINNMEEKVYATLKDFIDKNYLILPHISFREIFWWGKWENDQKLTDRVTKMHFDFGIYNEYMQPVLFVEVQGKDHKENPKVIGRDKFKAEVMKRCGMKLITIDCSETMTDQEISEKVRACIKREVPDREAYAVYCPTCKKRGENNLMMIRRNSKDGTFFYGCSTYGKNEQDKCATLNLEKVPPLYYGIPLFKEQERNV